MQWEFLRLGQKYSEEYGLEAVGAGLRTSDLGGHLGTSEFADEVITRTKAKLEVWATL